MHLDNLKDAMNVYSNLSKFSRSERPLIKKVREAMLAIKDGQYHNSLGLLDQIVKSEEFKTEKDIFLRGTVHSIRAHVTDILNMFDEAKKENELARCVLTKAATVSHSHLFDDVSIFVSTLQLLSDAHISLSRYAEKEEEKVNHANLAEKCKELASKSFFENKIIFSDKSELDSFMKAEFGHTDFYRIMGECSSTLKVYKPIDRKKYDKANSMSVFMKESEKSIAEQEKK